MSAVGSAQPAAPPVAPRTAQYDGARAPAVGWRPDLPTCLIAMATVAVLLAVANRYGYYRDELYFRVAGQHLDWDYIDQGPLVPLLARVQMAVFGDTVWALRVVPALLGGLTVIVAALTARAVGSAIGLPPRPAVERLVASAAAGCPCVLNRGHLLGPASVDLFVHSLIMLFVLHALATGGQRWWAAAAVLAGLDAYNRFLQVLLALGLVAGLLAAGPRRPLRGRGLLLGTVAGVAAAAPVLWWQATHGWPQVTIAGTISEAYGSRWLLPESFLRLAGPAQTVLIVVGLGALLFAVRARPCRSLAVAFVVVAAVLVALPGKAMYSSAFWLLLLACGGLVADAGLRRLSARRARVVGLGLLAALVLNTGYTVVHSLPVLPARTTSWHAILTEETVGWPELVRQGNAVYSALDSEQRVRAVVLTHNTAEAGAFDRYGPRYGLPRVYSAHNSYHGWGRPPDDATVAVTVGFSPAELAAIFRTCDIGGMIQVRNDPGVANFESYQVIIACSDPVQPWSQLWPRLLRVST